MMPARRAFTLIELLVVISIIALLVGILLPALGAARRTARSAICLTNQRQIMTAQHSYAADNKDVFAPGQDWKILVYEGENIEAPYWFVILTARGYAAGAKGATVGSSVYMCPEGLDEEVQDSSGNPITSNLFNAASSIPSNEPRTHLNGWRYIAQGTGDRQLRTNFAANTTSQSGPSFFPSTMAAQLAFPMQYSWPGDADSKTLPRTNLGEMIWPTETITFYDGVGGTMFGASGTNAYGRMIPRHGDNINYSFVDGHASSIGTGQVPDPKSNLAGSGNEWGVSNPNQPGARLLLNSKNEFAFKILAYNPASK